MMIAKHKRKDGSIFSRGAGVLTANSTSITANGSSSKAIAAFGFYEQVITAMTENFEILVLYIF